jgi:hypothetical protein
MAETSDAKSGDSAEKAYAAAVESVPAEVNPRKAAAADNEPVAFPSKSRRAAKVRTPITAEKVELKAPEVFDPAPGIGPAEKSVKAPKPVGKVKPVVKTVRAKGIQKAKAPAKAKTRLKHAEPIPNPKIPTTTPQISAISQLKDKIMATKTFPDFSEGLTDVFAEAQSKAKEAYEKSTVAMGEASEFAKGNVEALVESGKILAGALQTMGSDLAAEGRVAFETMTADAKELASVKSPTDFVKLQGEIMRRNFDNAVATGSKHSEAMLKLASEVFAPISGRVSLAVDKVRKAA